MKKLSVLLVLISLSFLQPYSSVFAQFYIDNIEFLGHNEQNRAHLMDLEIAGTNAYVANGFVPGTETYDFSNPYGITRGTRTGAKCWRHRAYGDTLFAFCRSDGLQIYSIAASLNLVGQCGSGASDRAFEGGALIGATLYAAAHQAGIALVNVSSLSNPSVTGTFPLTDNACWNIAASGDYLFIANGRYGLAVVRVGAVLIETAVLNLPGLANDIEIEGSTAVISLGVDGVAAVDISQPENPVLLDIAPSLGCAWGLGIRGNYAAVGSWRTLEVFDISNPHSISLAGWENTKTWAMGADYGEYQGEGMIAVADWRGVSAFRLGTETVPDIDAYPMNVDFGAVAASEDTTVTISNTGGAPLIVTSISTPVGITLSQSSLTLQPGASLDLTMTATGGAVNGYVTYNCNDPNETAFRQYVYANNSSFPQAGSAAPGFNLQGTDGVWYSLSDMRGNVVFLEFGGGW